MLSPKRKKFNALKMVINSKVERRKEDGYRAGPLLLCHGQDLDHCRYRWIFRYCLERTDFFAFLVCSWMAGRKSAPGTCRAWRYFGMGQSVLSPALDRYRRTQDTQGWFLKRTGLLFLTRKSWVLKSEKRKGEKWEQIATRPKSSMLVYGCP